MRTRSAPITIIDLTGVPYMDSAGLGALLGYYASCERSGHHFALFGVNPRVNTLLQVSKVDGILKSYPSIEDTEAGLKS